MIRFLFVVKVGDAPSPQREGLAHRAHPLGFAREILRGLGVESGLG